MRQFLKNKRVWLAAVAAALILCASLGSALAYFTDYDNASGGVTIHLQTEAEIEEDPPVQMTKFARVKNTGETDIMVRVKAFAGSQYTLAYSGEGWSEGEDGFMYYAAVLAPRTPQVDENGQVIIDEDGNVVYDYDTTETLNIGFDGPDAEQFSIIVVQECTPVLSYDDNGAPVVNWAAEEVE